MKVTLRGEEIAIYWRYITGEPVIKTKNIVTKSTSFHYKQELISVRTFVPKTTVCVLQNTKTKELLVEYPVTCSKDDNYSKFTGRITSLKKATETLEKGAFALTKDEKKEIFRVYNER